MARIGKLLVSLAALIVPAGSALAQNAISAKAGMINVADGDVFLIDGRGGEPQRIQPKVTEFLEWKEGQTLKTGEGRAEVLLTPGAFLRLGEESSVKLYSNRLSSVRLEVVSGSVLVDVVELLDGNSITLLSGGAEVSLNKAGLYRFDSPPARIRVFAGEAAATHEGQRSLLKAGRELVQSGQGWTLAKFDADKETDSLYRWSKRRSGYIAMANVSAARQASRSFLGASGFNGGSWYWNPYFGFATYIPWGDTIRSPFGYYYYTPATVVQVYYPPRSSPPAGRWSGGASGAFAGALPGRSAGGSTYTPSAGVRASAAPAAPSMGAGSTGTRGGGAVPAGAGAGGRGGRGN